MRIRSVSIVLVLLAGALLLLLAFAGLLLLVRQDGDPAVATLAPTVGAVAAQASRALPRPSPTLNPVVAGTGSPTAIPPATATPVASNTPTPTASATPAPYPKPVDDAEVDAVLSSLTLEQKVAQMLMIGLSGPSLDAIARQRVAGQGVGGIVLLGRNINGSQQLGLLTQALQDAARSGSVGLPLFIGWNHEGGPVLRRNAGLTPFPSAMAVGATGDPALAARIGGAIAAEMRSVGVNMNFAPVLDVNNNPANPVIGLRSFGGTAALVETMGDAFMKGQQAGGVVSVAKHFPGHGGVDVDSHLSLPTLSSSLEGIEQVELPPFRRAVTDGVGAIMVAHLNVPALDGSGQPSSLSAPIISGLLRNQLGYDGVVVTDDLGMGAIRNSYPLGEAAVQAVLAGNDLLLTVDSNTHFDTVTNALLAAVNNGRLSPERIDQSVRRLIRLKLAYDLDVPPTPLTETDVAAHRQLALDVALATVQASRDDYGWLPLAGPRLLLVSPTEFNAGTATGDGRSYLHELLAAGGMQVSELFYVADSPADIGQTQVQAVAQASAADAVVVVLWDAALRYTQFGEVAQETMVNQLLASGKPVIVVFGRLPYDAARVPNAPAQIPLYGDTAMQVEALAARLQGDGE